MIWYHISLLLCTVGFFKEIRPSEPFVTDYLQQPYRNVTADEVNTIDFDYVYTFIEFFFPISS